MNSLLVADRTVQSRSLVGSLPGRRKPAAPADYRSEKRGRRPVVHHTGWVAAASSCRRGMKMLPLPLRCGAPESGHRGSGNRLAAWCW